MRTAVTTLALGLAALACAGAATAQDQTTLAIPTFSLTLSPIYIAEEKGYWKEQGLEVKLPLIPGIGATNALIAGSVEFTDTTSASFLRANARGQKLVAIANTLEKVQIEIVVSKAFADKAGFSASDPIEKRAAALKGARIAVDAPNTIVHGYVKYVAKKGGLDPDRDVTVSPMQPPAMIQAYKSGQIDGFAMSRPWTAMARKDGAVSVVSSPAGDLPELNPFNYNLIITRPGVCEANPAVCRKLIIGLRKALELMHDQPAEALAILKKRFDRTDPDMVEEAFRGVMAGTPRSPEVKEAGFQRTEDYMVNGGIIKPEERITSFAGLYTNEYAK
jgi:ABC-type nitrate/sulfonate/bicarbonate transport system substrate-binding protein